MTGSGDEAPESVGENMTYDIQYAIDITDSKHFFVTLTVKQEAGELKRLALVNVGDRNVVRSDDGPLTSVSNGIEWHVPARGGQLRWQRPSTLQRADGSFDAMRTQDWAIFRAEDALPPIASVTRPGADARTQLSVRMPAGWSLVTPYAKTANRTYAVNDAGRRFDKPDGWIVAGDIGVRHDIVANTRIAVAAPKDAGARRLDTLAFMRWHMPYVRELFPEFPDRLLLAMAGDPFFRGGLSAPNSLFMHTDRPLISGNGTSTLLHELVHVGFSRTALDGEDWIVEGIAEYYSYQLLLRAGSVSTSRADATSRDLQQWAKQTSSLQAQSSSGSRTALATTVFASLDREVRKRTRRKTLDDVIRLLANKPDEISLDELRQAARETIGAPARSLNNESLSGYLASATMGARDE